MVDRVRPPFIELETATVGATGIHLRSDRRRFETWEKNYAAITGFGVAVRYALDVGVEPIWQRVRDLAGRARDGLASIPGVEVRDRGRVPGAIVTFDVEDIDPGEIRMGLAERAINVSTTTASSSPIDMEGRGIAEMVRASVHAYNTTDEVDHFVNAVADLAAR